MSDPDQSEQADRLRFQVEFAHAALKNITLVNGGAIVALLTFIGNSSAHFASYPMRWAFSWFVMGLTGAVAGYIPAFLSQLAIMNGRKIIGNIWLYFGLLLASGSLGMFAVGAFVALDAIT